MDTQLTTHESKLDIGIDIHKRSRKVHCSTELFSGKSFSMASEREQLKKYVDKHFTYHEISTAYEAGCFEYYAHQCFENYGWSSLLCIGFYSDETLKVSPVPIILHSIPNFSTSFLNIISSAGLSFLLKRPLQL